MSGCFLGLWQCGLAWKQHFKRELKLEVSEVPQALTHATDKRPNPRRCLFAMADKLPPGEAYPSLSYFGTDATLVMGVVAARPGAAACGSSPAMRVVVLQKNCFRYRVINAPVRS